MRYIIVLVLIFITYSLNAEEWEDQRIFSSGSTNQTLRILSSTDTSFFEPILKSYLIDNPATKIEYLVTGTASLDKIFRNTPEKYDLVISSAMDLQLKLVNDGFAIKIQDSNHPSWAKWRKSLFAFTIEPAAIVINKRAFANQKIPQSRQDLIKALRSRSKFFQNKLGTYDVRKSGLGYLFATQDARTSETYWRLMEVMGGLGTQLYCCSGDMIDDLISGKIAVAYNVLSSYAGARKKVSDEIEIILPADFPTTMMRTAMVSKLAPNVENAKNFMLHLLKTQLKLADKNNYTLPPLLLKPGQQTIILEPALMTYLDKLKRQTFIKEWERAIIQ
tara:strand:- start:172 stop:1170 length:999 start_codon:yes stop_codon:yes gene_type:complete